MGCHLPLVVYRFVTKRRNKKKNNLQNIRRYVENTFNFKGVTGEGDFWSIILIDAIIISILSCFGRLVSSFSNGLFFNPTAWLVSIYTLARGISFISLSVRRLHDIGKSGWWMLLSLWAGIASSASGISEESGIFGLIGLSGFICCGILLVFFCLPSKIDGNPYRSGIPDNSSIPTPSEEVKATETSLVSETKTHEEILKELEVAEKRRRETQSAYTKERQRVLALEAEMKALKSELGRNNAYALPSEIEELKFQDPDAYYAARREYEDKLARDSDTRIKGQINPKPSKNTQG